MTYYSVPDAADQLGINYRRLLRMVKRGEVPHEMLPTGLAIFSDEQLAQIKASWLRGPVVVRVIPERLEDDSPGCTCYSYAEGGPHDPFCALEA